MFDNSDLGTKIEPIGNFDLEEHTVDTRENLEFAMITKSILALIARSRKLKNI